MRCQPGGLRPNVMVEPAGSSVEVEATPPAPPRKGPLSFLSGAITALALGAACLALSRRVVGYYLVHPPHYEAAIAQSIATALKTLIVGMCFLAKIGRAHV